MQCNATAGYGSDPAGWKTPSGPETSSLVAAGGSNGRFTELQGRSSQHIQPGIRRSSYGFFVGSRRSTVSPPAEQRDVDAMAGDDDIARLADALSDTHVGDGELSYQGRGLKLDNAESVEGLVSDIARYPGLRALRLEGNTIGVEAAQAVAKALENKDQLQRCHWSDMFTGRLRSEIPTALRSLGSAITTAGARLTELDLSDNAFGPDGVKGIEQLLKSPACHSLKVLRLNNCGMGIGGGKILAEALTECHRRSSALGAPLRLRVFVAGRNRLENEGASALAQAFQLMGSLEEVHMPQNGINHSGIRALALAAQHNPHLRVLNLNDNTFTKRGALAMAQALRHLRNVQVINFGDCLVRTEGAIALSAILREGLPLLKVALSLFFCTFCHCDGGLPQLTYLHLEKNRFTSFPKGAFKLLPSLLALHLEDNAIAKLESGCLAGGGEGVRGLYLTGNAVNGVSARALEQANDLNILHLGGNKLKDVPSEALSKAGNLGELKLSGNPIRWVGANAFRALGATLKDLYLDNTGLEKMSKDSLAGLGAGLRSLYLEGNQLEEVPDLHPLTSLEVINLAENPLLCDCPLLPLRMWIEKVNLKVRATCANPPEIRGRHVKDVHIFRACPGGESLPTSPTLGLKTSKTPKATKPKPAQLNSPRLGKMSKAKPKPRTGLAARPGVAMKTSKRRSEA
ncbi:unnamed protein product [Merluccius merluccius]